jgi:hypothetical protein
MPQPVWLTGALFDDLASQADALLGAAGELLDDPTLTTDYKRWATSILTCARRDVGKVRALLRAQVELSREADGEIPVAPLLPFRADDKPGEDVTIPF